VRSKLAYYDATDKCSLNNDRKAQHTVNVHECKQQHQYISLKL